MEIVIGGAVFLALVLVIWFGQNLMDDLTDGIAEGILAAICWPFRAGWRAFAKHSAKQERLPKNFLTRVPAETVGQRLRQVYREGRLSEVNKVIVMADDPGRFRVGVTYADNVQLTFEDGSVGRPTGEPVFVFELHYRQHGPMTHGYFVWVHLPDDPDEMERVQIECIPEWALTPIYELDPQMELITHKDAQARGLAGAAAMPTALPGVSAFPRDRAFAEGAAEAGHPPVGPGAPPPPGPHRMPMPPSAAQSPAAQSPAAQFPAFARPAPQPAATRPPPSRPGPPPPPPPASSRPTSGPAQPPPPPPASAAPPRPAPASPQQAPAAAAGPARPGPDRPTAPLVDRDSQSETRAMPVAARHPNKPSGPPPPPVG